MSDQKYFNYRSLLLQNFMLLFNLILATPFITSTFLATVPSLYVQSIILLKLMLGKLLYRMKEKTILTKLIKVMSFRYLF